MTNHWLDSAKKKRVFKEVCDIGFEIWGEGGTMADLISALNDEQSALFLNSLITQFVGDEDELTFGFETLAS